MNQNLPTEPPYFDDYLRLIELVATLRILAYDRSLTAPDAMRRIRDEFGVHDGGIPGDDR